MRHFTLEQWADFARNTLKTEDKVEMKAHLETGCKRCGDALRTWSRVRDVSARERAQKAPAETVRLAKAMFAGRQTEPKAGILELLFDSRLQPAMAGARSAGTSARQLLYAAGAYRIDLRMEPQADTERVSVVGQVLNSADPAQMIAPIPVTLVKSGKVMSSSHTGTFGEFQLECKLSERLQLALRLPDGVGVEIPLLEPTRAAFTGELEVNVSKEFKSKARGPKQSTRKRV